MCIQVNMAGYTLDKWPAHLRADNYTFTPNFKSPICLSSTCMSDCGKKPVYFEPKQTPGERENTQKIKLMTTRIQTLEATTLTAAPTH